MCALGRVDFYRCPWFLCWNRETQPRQMLRKQHQLFYYSLQHLWPAPIWCSYPWGILTVIWMIYFSFHNQKTNKIFYHLLGRLDVFLFISSLSGSIKFPLPFSFYNSWIEILFCSFFMLRLIFFFFDLIFSHYILCLFLLFYVCGKEEVGWQR